MSPLPSSPLPCPPSPLFPTHTARLTRSTVYLKTQGQDPSAHPVADELARVKSYVHKLEVHAAAREGQKASMRAAGDVVAAGAGDVAPMEVAAAAAAAPGSKRKGRDADDGDAEAGDAHAAKKAKAKSKGKSKKDKSKKSKKSRR